MQVSCMSQQKSRAPSRWAYLGLRCVPLCPSFIFFLSEVEGIRFVRWYTCAGCISANGNARRRPHACGDFTLQTVRLFSALDSRSPKDLSVILTCQRSMLYLPPTAGGLHI